MQPPQYRRGGKEVRLYSAGSLGQLVLLQVQKRNYVVGSLYERLCTTYFGQMEAKVHFNTSSLTKFVDLAQRCAFKSLSRGAYTVGKA